MVLVAALLEREKRLEGDVGGFMSVTGWVGDVDETMVAETEVFFVLGLFKPYGVGQAATRRGFLMTGEKRD